MTVDELTSLDADERAELIEWRLGLLLDAGFGERDATIIAGRADVSAHEAARLVTGGHAPGAVARALL